MDSVDMLIIVPSGGKLTAQAERLAKAHGQYSNLRCAVVQAEHIYNEFSSGTPDATAYRRFLKMLYDRGSSDGTAPKYLLLFGDCAWDNRMKSSAWRTYSPNDYLLCYQSENSYSNEALKLKYYLDSHPDRIVSAEELAKTIFRSSSWILS
jgi:hypothetical protein